METLISRAYAICFNYVSFDFELKFLQQYFSNNGYPIFLFDRYVKEFLSKLYTSEQETEYFNIFYILNCYTLVPNQIGLNLNCPLCLANILLTSRTE